MTAKWKLLYGSVIGTSHKKRGEPCQDYSCAFVVPSNESPILVAACSDGAGSAALSQIGSRVACNTFVQAASSALESGLPLHSIERDTILHWHGEIVRRLSFEACVRNVELRDFACTLLTAIVSGQRCIYSQIGDGAIVVNAREGYRPIFWPQSGEYASTTFFLTGDNLEQQLECSLTEEVPDNLAMFTDGLQSLALHFASRSVHAPFFEPMFESLRKAADTEELEIPLRQFLASKQVCDRTDDDKTLLLATLNHS